MRKLLFFSLISLIVVYSSCKREEPEEESFGNIVLKFSHKVQGNNIIMDTLLYVNTAGNHYMVNEIQYFISDLTLYRNAGQQKLINADKDIHYVDTDIPSTLTWSVYDKLEVGTYDSISFIFGITASKNIPYRFVNPPESFMFWPNFLGGPNGGYHYLKLNGKWLDTNSVVSPFDFHLGVGQIYAGGLPVVDSITGYVQNYFRVSLPNSSFSIHSDAQIVTVKIAMDVHNWFNAPVYDHNVFGSYTMQNQQAMQAIKDNGNDVFSVIQIE